MQSVNRYAFAPLLTQKDEQKSSAGGIDPLGTEPLADALAVKLAPGVRERQRHPRFLTAMAVSLSLCDEFGDEVVAPGPLDNHRIECILSAEFRQSILGSVL